MCVCMCVCDVCMYVCVCDVCMYVCVWCVCMYVCVCNTSSRVHTSLMSEDRPSNSMLLYCVDGSTIVWISKAQIYRIVVWFSKSLQNCVWVCVSVVSAEWVCVCISVTAVCECGDTSYQQWRQSVCAWRSAMSAVRMRRRTGIANTRILRRCGHVDRIKSNLTFTQCLLLSRAWALICKR